ncbi:hypothetical protein D3C80_1120170 [compost metagenome]
MGAQVVQGLRRAVLGQIGGRGAQDAAVRGQPVHGGVSGLIAADPHGHIDVLGHQVDEGVGQVQLQRQPGMGVEEGRQQRGQTPPSERGRGRDPQHAARLGRAARHQAFQVVHPVEDAHRPVIDHAPGLGRGQPSRGALDQPHPQPVLQPRQPPRGHGRRQVQPPGGGG